MGLLVSAGCTEMPSFDRDQQKVVVRVVYDGPANAGKTTNLAQLCRFFTTTRRSELVAPEERAGRTIFFDWLELDGGLVGGYRLRCQLVTVPGQGVFSHRRRHLLRKADAVVFVCESTTSGVEIGRRMVEGLRPLLARETGDVVPLVVQANKQDLDGGLGPEEVGQRLGVARGVSLVGARAHEGVGVRETVVLAIRAAANQVQNRLLQTGIEALSREVETSVSLHEALLAEEGPGLPRATVVLSTLDERGAAAVEASPTPAVAPEIEPTRTVAVADESGATSVGPPPRPTSTVPLGSVWPAAPGRPILRELEGREMRLCLDLVGQHGTADGSGASDGFIYQAGDWCLKTSRRRCFANPDEARGAMLQMARRKTLLGPLLAPGTVLCLQADEAGGTWLWTVAPWLTTLRNWMERSDSTGDVPSLSAALETFAQASVRSLALAARAGIVLDVHPSNFALSDGQAVYLDDDIAAGSRVPAIGHALLRRFDEYEKWPGALENYVRALMGGLSALSADEIRSLALARAIADTLVRTLPAQEARQRLLATLEARP